MIEREKVISIEAEEEKEEKKVFISSLDRRDGRVPSWAEISGEFRLDDFSRGEKKIFRAFYRAQRFFAQGRKTKGRRLINSLDKLPHFVDFEDRHGHTLTLIAKKVRGKEG